MYTGITIITLLISTMTAGEAPKNISVVEGHNAVLPCVVNYLGKGYEVMWTKVESLYIISINQFIYSSDSRMSVSVEDERSWNLEIKFVQEKDRGQYKCEVHTKHDGTLSQVFNLEVLLHPDIIDEETSDNVTVTEGETATLVCKGRGRPNPVIRWIREDSKPITQMQKVNGVITAVSEDTHLGETLVLERITLEDSGYYLCIANNSVKPAVSKRIHVEVLPSSAPKNLTVVELQEAVFTCIVNNPNKENMVIWSKGSYSETLHILSVNEILLTNDLRIFISHEDERSWNFHIKYTSGNDSGQYICQVENRHGIILYQKVWNLEVLVRPHIIEEETSSYVTVTEGETVTLVCKGGGRPEPVIRWERLDKQPFVVTSDDSFGMKNKALENYHLDETVVLEDITMDDAGIYVCIVNNDVGFPMTKSVHVDVLQREATETTPTPDTSATNMNTSTTSLFGTNVDSRQISKLIDAFARWLNSSTGHLNISVNITFS